MSWRRHGILSALVVAAVAAPIVPAVSRGPDDAKGPPVLRTGDVPIGSLGHRLGDYLTIEGARLDGPKTGVATLRVDTVNGRKLPEPVAIWVDNLDLPKGGRCKLKGYESARMIGKAPARCDAAEEEGRPAPVPQAGWQVQLYFVVLRVVAPAGLMLRDRP